MRKRDAARLAAVALLATGLAGITNASWAANDCSATGVTQTPAPDAGGVSVHTPAGGVCGRVRAQSRTGHVWADGEGSNPAPAKGYVSAGDDGEAEHRGICVSDDGRPSTGGTAPTCQSPDVLP